MHHKLTCNAALLAQTLKDATVYTSKDVYSEATCHVLLTVKGKSLTVIACDGLGYYERRIPLVIDKGEKPSLPGKEQRLCLTCQEALALHRRIPTRLMGNATLELDDPKPKDRQTLATLTLPDGASTTFFAKTDVILPDYTNIIKLAEKGKKIGTVLSNVCIPVHEMIRAGKVLPTRDGKMAHLHTAKGVKGYMALLELKEDDTDVRIIFMLSELAKAA